MTYQVIRTEQTEEGTVYVMSNTESVLVRADGSSRCRNIYGRGLADTGRFAHACAEMRRAVKRFREANQERVPRGCHECGFGKVAGCWRCGSL